MGVKTSTTEQAESEISFREFLLPPSLRELRQKLGQKAKQQKRFRFYSLSGLVCRTDVLRAAWEAVQRNEGAPGVEGVSIEQIAATPERTAAFLDERQASLRNKSDRAQAVRRVYIPKANGKLRPLGIPTVRRNRRGTPQGGVLSPLLANVYLHWLDHLFGRGDGPAHWAKAKLIRSADDFVVLARHISGSLQGWIESKREGWLGLEINREKTRGLDLGQPGQSLDFLGYTFRYSRDPYGRAQRYWNLEPSRKAMARERQRLRELIDWHQSPTPLPELIGRLNRPMRGWAKYFGLGYPRKAFRQLNHFVRCRLGKHLHRRSQRGWRVREGVSLYAHLDHLGLVSL